MDQKRLERFLTAVWPGHRRIDQPQINSWLQRSSNAAYGALAPEIQPVVLRSYKRDWRVAKMEDRRHLVVVDLSYSDLLRALETVILDRSVDLDTREAVATATVGWSFLWASQHETAAVLLALALTRRNLMANLAQRSKDRPGQSASTVFVLLHEIAHHLVDSRHPAITDLRRMVETKLNAQIEAQLAMREDLLRGASRPGYTLRVDIPDTTADGELLAPQLEVCEQGPRPDPEVLRELTCDVVATVALLGWRLDRNLLLEDFPQRLAMSPKELGDTLMLSVQTLRLMQIVGMAKSEAEVIRDNRPVGEFTANLMLQTIRKNVLSNVCSQMFRSLVERCAPSVDGSDPSGNFPLNDDAFLASLILMDELTVANVMQPLSNVFELVRTKEMYDPMRRDMIARLKPELQSNLSAAAGVLHSWLPF